MHADPTTPSRADFEEAQPDLDGQEQIQRQLLSKSRLCQSLKLTSHRVIKEIDYPFLESG